LKYRLPSILTIFLAASSVSAQTSVFRDRFQQGTSVPYPILNLKQSLESFVASPGDDFAPALVHSMVPFGRSLQAGQSDAAHPRVIFGYILSPFTDGGRPYYRDIVDRIFIAYSEIQNTLEIISWNNYEGRFNFESVRNYIPSPGNPQTFVDENTILYGQMTKRQLCMTCHQAGGPIYAEKPWSESTSGFAPGNFGHSPMTDVVKQAVGSDHYLGLEIQPFDEQGNPASHAGEIHVVIQDAHASLLTGRRLAGQGCADNLICRRIFLESVLSLARQGFYDAPVDNFLEVIPYRSALMKEIGPGWRSDQFAYIDPTLKDRNPLTSTPLGSTLAQNPTTPRALVHPIRVDAANIEDAAYQMLLRGYEGFGFLYQDAPLIQKCTESDIKQLFATSDFDSLVKSWNLNDSDRPIQTFVPLYRQVLDLVLTHCKGAVP
jgi:hypothetical protein